MKIIATLVFLATTALAVAADKPAALDPSARLAEAHKLASGLKYQKGDISLKNGLAKISVPEGYRYLDGTDTSTVLNKLWGNPGGVETLGMIVPASFDPIGGDTWAAVITYDDNGHVKDDDAATINYNDLLKEMKEGTAEASKEREKQGYGSVALVGWAAPPHYDAQEHKLYWAKEIIFGDSPEHTLNYNIRMLGRRGVLVVNVVAEMNRLRDVEASTPKLLSMVNFQEGHRYADFNGSTDKVATYGLAALIAGGVAAKVGLFKGLWIAILALKKFIIIGAVAAAGFVKKFFSRNRAGAV